LFFFCSAFCLFPPSPPRYVWNTRSSKRFAPSGHDIVGQDFFGLDRRLPSHPKRPDQLRRLFKATSAEILIPWRLKHNVFRDLYDAVRVLFFLRVCPKSPWAFSTSLFFDTQNLPTLLGTLGFFRAPPRRRHKLSFYWFFSIYPLPGLGFSADEAACCF